MERDMIESFLAEKKLALVGASSKSGKFGNAVLKELSSLGYEIYVVHPHAQSIQGHSCYGSLEALPDDIGGMINVVPPDQTETLVQEAYAKGINKIWMQQGSESEPAVKYCLDHSIKVIHGECILMFAEPKGLHKFHHWLWGVLGKLPQA